MFSALRIYLHMAFLMGEGDLNKVQDKKLLKRLYIYANDTDPSTVMVTFLGNFLKTESIAYVSDNI